MRIGHASDLHGDLRELLSGDVCPDVWVLSGDVCPNETRGIVAHEVPYQTAWFRGVSDALVARFGDRPVLVVPGNHDYIDLAALLRSCGVDATNVTPEGVEVAGVRFAGFREVPWMAGEWNGECRDFADLVGRTFDSDPEVIVTHAPPAGILDDDGLGEFGHGGGIPALTTALTYRPHRVRAHLFGHIHEHGGRDVEEMGIRFYNGAEHVRIVEV